MIYKNSTIKLWQPAFYLSAFSALLFLSTQTVTAATRTWDGGGATNNFSEAANWSDDTAPTSADEIIFNATSTKNVTVDTAQAITSLRMNAGYTGTISQTAALTVSNFFDCRSGTFNGGAVSHSIGALFLNGGTFNATSATLTLTNSSDYVLDRNSGTFNNNNGTVIVAGNSSYFRGVDTTFNNLTIKQYLINFMATVTVDGLLLIDTGATLTNSNFALNGDVTFASGVLNGSANLTFGGTATRTTTINGATVANPIIVNNPNITVTTGATSGTVTWSNKVTLQAGTLQQTAADYLFNVSAGFNNPGFSVAGGTFQGSTGAAIFNTTIGISSGNLNGGSGSIGTNAVNCPTFPASSYYFQQSGGSFSGGTGNARFCDLRRTGGAFTAPSGTMTILSYADLTGGNAALGASFTANGGTLVIADGASVYAQSTSFFNVTLQGGGSHGLDGSPKPIINGTFNLAEGAFSSGNVAANGDVIYGANFTGGGGRLFFEDGATRTVNLPARNILLGMTLDNPNITVTTSGAGASTFTNFVEVKRGLFQQGAAILNFGANGLTVSGGTFQGSSAALNPAGIVISGGIFQGGTGLITTGTIETTGGTFSSGGDFNLSTYRQSGGTFNAPAGLMTVVADWTHTAGGTFNAGTGSVKFTGYNTFNCANSYASDVNVTETFYNLEIANAFCNARYIAAGDTLIVNNNLRLSSAGIGGGRIRPLGTLTIDATNNGYTGSTVVEFVTPNRNFVINNPSSTVNMLPVEMCAANSTLTSSGAGRINFVGMTLTDGTVNQGVGIWDITNPGYAQSGGTFNGSAAALFIANGAGNPLLSGGVFNSGTGKMTSSFRMTGGTMNIAGDLDTSIFTLEGGTFNAPLGTMLFTGSNGNCYFTHTASAGAFNARTGTVAIQFGGCGFDVNARETFNNLIFRGGNFITANDTLIVNGVTTFNGGYSSGGSIEANGDVQHLNGGTGNTNGNPNVGTTVLKFVDTATRTVNFNTSNQTYATLATLVDNPNITINFGTTASADVIVNALTVQRGTINQGAGRAGVLNNFAQSGGTYNAGTFAGVFNLPTTGIAGNFTLSGGDFNAGSYTQFENNYTHTAGGNFNYGTGTVTFNATGGVYAPTIDVNATENFNNVIFSPANGLYRREIAAGDTIIANGNLTFGGSGAVNGGTLEAKRNVAVNAGFGGGTTALSYTGTIDQTYSNAGGTSPSGAWTINKPNSSPRAENAFAPAAVTTLFVSGSIGAAPGALVPLNVVSGDVRHTGNYNHGLASLTIVAGSRFINEFGGTITLGGDVTNNGTISLDGGGTATCGVDAVALRSTSAAQRAWNGTGNFRMVDVDVQNQGGTAPITVYSGTNTGGNGANFTFNTACLAPTSSAVTVGGNVVAAGGRGIGRAQIVMIDQNGNERYAMTNPFGFYRFADVPVGATYVLRISHKTERFANQSLIMSVTEETTNVNFIALER